MAKFSKEVVVNRSPEEVYDFLLSADNFHFMPGIEKVEKVKEKAIFNILGSEKIPLIGLETVRYEIHIDKTEKPSLANFHTVDFMCSTKGSWRLTGEDGATRLSYEVQYTVPGSFLGKVIDKLLMENNMAKESDEYLSSIQLCLEKVEKVMTKDVVSVDVSTMVSEVTAKMDKTNIRYFPVTKDGKLVGVVTDGDILSKMYAYGPSSENSPVENLMTTGVKTIRTSASVLEAIKLLRENKIRRIPVLSENEELVGIISATDLEAYLGMLKKK